jgi:hypothetical protein
MRTSPLGRVVAKSCRAEPPQQRDDHLSLVGVFGYASRAYESRPNVTRLTFLILNLAVGFYNVGTVWANEVDIFRSWKLLDQKDFKRVREAHWKKLPYWVLFPWGLEIAGSTALIWYHPAGSPTWAIYGGTGCLWLSLILTIFMWGQWQKKLSGDPLSSESPYLAKILKTHWIRTSLMSAYAIIVLVWVIQILA